MKKSLIFKRLAVFLIFVFIFLLKGTLVKAEENKYCVLEDSIFGHYNGYQYFEPGSTICALSDVAVSSTFSHSYYHSFINGDILSISPISLEGINQDKIQSLLQTYYQCNNNGQWLDHKLENGKICSMGKSFWDKSCHVENGCSSIGFMEIIENNPDLNNMDDNFISDLGEELFLESTEEENRCYPNIKEYLENKGIMFDKDEWCIHILFTDLCFSDFWNSAVKKTSGFFGLTDENDNYISTKELFGFPVCKPGYTPSDPEDPNCVCLKKDEGLADILCQRYLNKSLEKSDNEVDNKEFTDCKGCFANGGYWSGLGCMYFSDWKTFFEKNVFGFLIGLAGVIALFCIIYAAFQIQTSQGKPEKIKKGQELLTSCIMGLMLIIFSVFILRFIGVNILRIPFDKSIDSGPVKNNRETPSPEPTSLPKSTSLPSITTTPDNNFVISPSPAPEPPTPTPFPTITPTPTLSPAPPATIPTLSPTPTTMPPPSPAPPPSFDN